MSATATYPPVWITLALDKAEGSVCVVAVHEGGTRRHAARIAKRRLDRPLRRASFTFDIMNEKSSDSTLNWLAMFDIVGDEATQIMQQLGSGLRRLMLISRELDEDLDNMTPDQALALARECGMEGSGQ